MAGTNGHRGDPDAKAAGLSASQYQLRGQARGIAARIMTEVIRRTERSPRQVGQLLAEHGWLGRGDRKPLREEAVRNWLHAESDGNPPAADIMIGLVLLTGVSLDEFVFGSGLRADYERLAEKMAQGEEELAVLHADVGILARALNATGRLEGGHAAEVRRLSEG